MFVTIIPPKTATVPLQVPEDFNECQILFWKYYINPFCRYFHTSLCFFCESIVLFKASIWLNDTLSRYMLPIESHLYLKLVLKMIKLVFKLDTNANITYFSLLFQPWLGIFAFLGQKLKVSFEWFTWHLNNNFPGNDFLLVLVSLQYTLWKIQPCLMIYFLSYCQIISIPSLRFP